MSFCLDDMLQTQIEKGRNLISEPQNVFVDG